MGQHFAGANAQRTAYLDACRDGQRLQVLSFLARAVEARYNAETCCDRKQALRVSVRSFAVEFGYLVTYEPNDHQVVIHTEYFPPNPDAHPHRYSDPSQH
jgi:hypothetical protein